MLLLRGTVRLRLRRPLLLELWLLLR